MIEVLVVVAIIALLVAILIPSLARAREQARSVQCLSGIKQLASTTTMYTVDNKSRLPGPLHPAIYRYTDDFRIEQEKPENRDKAIWSAFLPYHLRRYMTSSRTKTVDETAECPTSARLLSIGKEEVSASQPDRRPMQYVVNTTLVNDNWPNDRNGALAQGYPGYGTDPAYYFGRINIGQAFTDAGVQQPKRIEQVKFAGREWLVADAWHYQIGARPVGTWPYPEYYASYSIKEGDRYFVPTWAIHQTTRQFSNPIGGVYTENNPRMPRFTDGRTNTAFFDGHGEGVRGWKGTANPCYEDQSTGCLN